MARAANSTIAPCAKLNTPEALKISTKPSATREYNIPAMRPPISVSIKKPMRHLSSVAGAKIGADDLRIGTDLVRAPSPIFLP
jgi:hypothetical protein